MTQARLHNGSVDASLAAMVEGPRVVGGMVTQSSRAAVPAAASSAPVSAEAPENHASRRDDYSSPDNPILFIRRMSITIRMRVQNVCT